MKKPLTTCIILMFLISVGNSVAFAITISKKNYFAINYNFIWPHKELKEIVNGRLGKGIAVDWENYSFKNVPLKITLQYNEWDKGISNYKDWQTGKIQHLKLSLGWVEHIQKARKGFYGVLYLAMSKWRVEKDGKFFLSTTKIYPDVELGYIFKNNWIISFRGIGTLHLTKDIKINTTQISFGKRF